MPLLKTPLKSLVLLFALTTASLIAGCLSGDEAIPASYDEARAASGPVLEPGTTDSAIRLKLLEPAQQQGVATGEREVLLLLFDSEADTPVEDADFGEDRSQCGPSHGFCAEMPDMGHGTSPERAPVHVDHGVYRGMTTISMAGNWTLHFRPQIDSQIVEFNVDIRAAE